MYNPLTYAVLILSVATFPLSPAFAQQTDSTAEEVATSTDTEAADEALLSDDQLDELVAPVALYPDTLLIQILVAATYPLEIIKAQRWLEANDGLSQEDLSSGIYEQTWDPSVQVLAEAFPDVLGRMAENVDWTELAGSAMLAQSDDIMAAIQRMREQAIDAGSLVDSPEQVVTRDETDAVTILPADPEVIYVPQYNTETVYVSDSSNNNNNDALLFFGSAILIAAIIDNNNDDYWGGYWGCRNCGGWNGRPIHYRGGDIDIDGNVNIGNDINIGNEWKPDRDRQKRGKDQIRDRKDRGELKNRPGSRPDKMPSMKDRPSRGDQMRRDLGAKTGARDISRPENRDAARQLSRDRPNAGNQPRPKNKGVGKRPAAPKNKAAAPSRAKAKPSSQRKAAPKQQKKKASHSSVKRHQSGNRARKSSSRGGGHRSHGGGRGRR